MKEIYWIVSLLIFIRRWAYLSSGACTEKNIKADITQCENNKQKVLLYLFPECSLSEDNKTRLIQSSLLEVNCENCQDGYYLSYNRLQKKMECAICPQNTYSIGGNFRIRGSYYEWTNDNLALFKNECFIRSKNTEYSSCSGMTNKKLQFIQSGNSFNENVYDYTYISQFSKTFHLVKHSQLAFSYKKDTLKQTWGRNGIFRLFINYQIEINDIDLSPDMKEVAIPLVPGTYTFLWQYIKTVGFQSKPMALTIESISLTGIDSAARECLTCGQGISEPGSDHCNLCTNEKYFNITLGQCLDCPEGTFNPSNNQCVHLILCTKKDYKTIYSNKCNQKTHKMTVTYELISQLCKEEAKLGEEEIDCNECFPGQFIQKDGNNSYNCEYCPINSYSEGNNFLNCKVCDGIATKVQYYYPDNSNNFETNEVETVDEGGKLHVIFDQEEKSKEAGWIEAAIDGITATALLTNNHSKYDLTKGKHTIKVKTKHASIKYIKVSHTSTGGGYKCENASLIDPLDGNTTENVSIFQCSPGFEFDSTFNSCIKCKDKHYKASNSNETCIECPQLTYVNEKSTNCVPYQVANQNTHKLKVSIGNLKETQNSICNLTGSLCNSYFYGPLRDNKHNMFFISYFSANTFHSNDLTYKFNSKSSKLPSFIYMLNSTSDQSQPNTKIVSSLGREIASVQFVKGQSSRGLITHYINGDTCSEDSTQTYEAYLYLNCTKKGDDVLSFLSPRFISKDKCRYYFEWSSKEACPICLRSEVSVIASPCKKNSRRKSFIEGSICIIANTTLSLGDDMNNTDDKLMITSNDSRLIKEYNLNDITAMNGEEGQKSGNEEENDDYEEDYYLMDYQKIISCSFISDLDPIAKYAIIIVPILYVIIVIVCVVICCKYRKIKGDYHMLVETPESNLTETNLHPQIEIVSSRAENLSGDLSKKPSAAEEHSIEVKIHHNQNNT